MALRISYFGVLLALLTELVKPDASQMAPAIAWRDGPALQLPLDHHATFLVQSSGGNFLYVAGGTNYKELYDNIVRARIDADGSLGAWEAAGAYPAPLA